LKGYREVIMRDMSRSEIEGSRPELPVNEVVEVCYQKLIGDNKHGIEDEIVHGLTFEELLGALLLCRDHFEEHKRQPAYNVM
jgi:hypothetical protein